MSELFLPVLSHFQEHNFWTSSVNRMRYRILPEDDQLQAEVWEGPWNYKDSRVEEKTSFPMTEEGLTAIREWAERWAAEINARPSRTMAETIEMRDAVRAEKAAEQGNES